MALPTKSLDQITEADLLTLVQAGEAESKVIEYKETLPGNADSDKKEFLYDVSSFANAAGGTLVYGMKAKDGVPVELTGLVGLNSDAEKLRLQAIIQSGLQPRIPTAEIEAATLANGNKVLLIKIQRSWFSPHMVTFKGGSKFYSRHSNGKYQLDVAELRSAFLASETVSEKLAAFRTDRLSKILNDEIPVRIKESAKIIFHLLPLSSFSSGYSVDLKVSPVCRALSQCALVGAMVANTILMAAVSLKVFLVILVWVTLKFFVRVVLRLSIQGVSELIMIKSLFLRKRIEKSLLNIYQNF